jgi:hypothetical protein
MICVLLKVNPVHVNMICVLLREKDAQQALQETAVQLLIRQAMSAVCCVDG